LAKLNLSPDQLQYLSQLNNANSAPPLNQELNQEGSEIEATPKKEKPIDNLEKQEQPADNDDDEKLSDNHRKMAKIDLK
jgi:hypothetical protein